MSKLQTIADMLMLANRLSEIVAEMEIRKQAMLLNGYANLTETTKRTIQEEIK